MKLKTFLAALCVAILAGCGGGGGSNVRPDTPPTGALKPEPEPEPDVTTERTTLSTRQLSATNTYSYDPTISLPRDGSDGIRVTRPTNIGSAGFTIYYDARAESIFDLYGEKFGELAKAELERAIAIAYKQWSRHIPDMDITTEFGVVAGVCDTAFGCAKDARHGRGYLVIPHDHLVALMDAFAGGVLYQDAEWLEGLEAWAIALATHEVGHNVAYMRKPGEACLNNQGRNDCAHAPNSTGSVMSYARVGRVHVDRNDIERVPGGQWNASTTDEYTVWKAPEPASIETFGFWLRHDFDVEGQYREWPYIRGGYANVTDVLRVTPFVSGTPSVSHGITRGKATWTGEDNFLGYYSYATEAGLVRADTTAQYTFGTDGGTMRVDMDAFEYFVPGTAEWAPEINEGYSVWYEVGCDSDICGGEDLPFEGSSETFDLKVGFYPEGGDPSGWAAGTLTDRANQYAGAFVAEKD